MKPVLLCLCILLAMVFAPAAPAVAQQTPYALADTSGRQVSYVWQQPVYASATVAMFFAGASPLFIGYAQRPNMLIREEMQLFRRSQFNNRRYEFDNGLQCLPIFSMLLLNLAGVPTEHNLWQQSLRAASAFAISSAIVLPVKELTNEMRPDRSSTNSFPSGHTATAFLGAELLRLEYGQVSPWIPAAGYTIAAFTGVMRIYNDRHWAGDVLAGAAIGIVSANISFWLNDKIDKFISARKKQQLIGVSCCSF